MEKRYRNKIIIIIIIIIVKPLLKKNNLDPNVLENYRPISNLPFLYKILEKVIFHQLSDHLASNNLLTPHQSAYRSRHSTETAILRILTDILNSLDENKIAVLLLLDLSAAFDTIDHQIHLSRLNHTFGIRETALNWFRSYLSGRKQFVLVGDHRSSESPLKYGVPQGSVLGPVLFILYTTPLSDVIRGHSVSHEMFADDTQLLHSSAIDDYPTLTSTLQSCTSDVDTWMSANKLKLNCEKTEAVRFYRQPHHSPDLLPSSLMLGSSTIEFSDTVRDLGVLLDSDFSMKQHVTKTCQLAYMELKKIAAIHPFLTEDATKTLVSSYILSRLDYCNCVLLGCPSNVIHPLQRIQNSAARLICKSPWSQPCSPLLKKLHWLPVEERIINVAVSVLRFSLVTLLPISLISSTSMPHHEHSAPPLTLGSSAFPTTAPTANSTANEPFHTQPFITGTISPTLYDTVNHSPHSKLH